MGERSALKKCAKLGRNPSPTEERFCAVSRRVRAASVHILTAIGAVLALLALRAAHAGDWQAMFACFGLYQGSLIETREGFRR